MSISGVGIDVIEIRRFRDVLRKRQDRFLGNTFTDIERSYCFSYKDPAPHLAGTFAAKEAVQKVSKKSLAVSDIEIRREKSGRPRIYLKGKRASSLLISISHTDTLACAIAVTK